MFKGLGAGVFGGLKVSVVTCRLGGKLLRIASVLLSL